MIPELFCKDSEEENSLQLIQCHTEDNSKAEFELSSGFKTSIYLTLEDDYQLPIKL